MRATGIVRKIDSVGRVVIPRGILNSLGLTVGHSLEFYIGSDNSIILIKYQKACIICEHNNLSELVAIGDDLICTGCIERIKNM